MNSEDLRPLGEPLFEVLTPPDVLIRTTPSYWEKIIRFKHPIMRGQEEQVKQTLKEPREIRRSTSDPAISLRPIFCTSLAWKRL